MSTCCCTGACKSPPYTCSGYSIETEMRFSFPQIQSQIQFKMIPADADIREIIDNQLNFEFEEKL